MKEELIQRAYELAKEPLCGYWRRCRKQWMPVKIFPALLAGR